MVASEETKLLRIVLRVVGVVFIFGIFTLGLVWPSGWVWHNGGQSPYLQMIWGVYATLGIFLILAARDPLANLGLIWFTVWSSVVHAGVMAVQALVYSQHRGHLLGDVPALLIIAIILALATPSRATAKQAYMRAA